MSFSAVDVLARLQLEARRRGIELRLRILAPALQELVELAGLEEVLGLELERQPEEREERLGLEEERQLGHTAG